MKILIIHLGTILENFVATSIIKNLIKKNKDIKITWCVNLDSDKYIFKYNNNINNVISFNELKNIDDKYDVLINLHPDFSHEKCEKIVIKNTFGFGFHAKNNKYQNILYENEISEKNIFQIYYNIAGLKWRGEGYNVKYYPKNRTKNKIGISVAHANLRNYIMDKLYLEKMKLWHIPYKKNIFKKMDEINKCKKIITDDLMTFHLAMNLHKYVYFLQILPMNYKLELFGNGEIYQIPKNIIQ